MTLPPGAVRDEKTGGLMTVATPTVNARPDVVPVRQPGTIRPGVATALGLLTALAAFPGVVVVALEQGGLPVWPWLKTAAVIGGAAAPLLAAGAFWASGGSLQDALALLGRRHLPPPPPKDGAP